MLFQRIIPVIIFALCGAAAVVGAQETSESPLHQAAEAGDVAEIKRLVADGADVNRFDSEGTTPLQWAAVEGRVNAITTLIGLGADVNGADADGFTPMHLAAFGEHISAVATLAEAGADVNAIATIIFTSASEILQDIPSERYDLFFELTRGFKFPFTNIVAPIHFAAVSSSVMISVLAEYGADVNHPNSYGETPLYIAILNGNIDGVNMLIALKADVRWSGRGLKMVTPLHVAAIAGHPAVIAALINAGANVNQADSKNATSLHYASRKGDVEVVFAIVNAGANVNLRDIYGKTAEDVARRLRGQDDAIAIFLKRAAERNKKKAEEKAEDLLRRLD